jgi:uncharacterized membrane protein YgaE (UPF0421/DUF939 family)
MSDNTPQAEPPAKGWQMAAIYAVQMVVCSVILLAGYHAAGAPSVQWAIVSVAVVLQPGLKESMGASLSRIWANLIGAGVGLVVGLALGDSAWQFLLAVVIVIFVCQRLKLEQSLRSACVAVTIVMLTYQGRLVSSSLERTISVIVGSGLALLVQYAAVRISERYFKQPNVPQASA